MIKRLITIQFLLVTLILVAVQPASASSITKSDMEIFLNGKQLSFAQSYVLNSRMVVPYREIAEKLGSTVQYKASTKTVIVQKGSKTLTLKIGSNVATVNGKRVNLDVSATLVSNATYVPIRFIAENFGVTVKYNSSKRTVTLTSEQETVQAYNVAIESFAFSPKEITIEAGSKIVFTNKDSAIHTVTARNGSFNSGNLSKSETFSRTFTKPGEYVLYCIPHDFMEIKVVVK
jgi:plastocyanin